MHLASQLLGMLPAIRLLSSSSVERLFSPAKPVQVSGMVDVKTYSLHTCQATAIAETQGQAALKHESGSPAFVLSPSPQSDSRQPASPQDSGKGPCTQH